MEMNKVNKNKNLERKREKLPLEKKMGGGGVELGWPQEVGERKKMLL